MKRAGPRAIVCWAACAALLINALLLPATLSVAIGLRAARGGAAGLNLCHATSARDLPGKANPAPLVHHCPLCMLQSGLPALPAPTAAHKLTQIADSGYQRTAPVLPAAPFRHGPVQARAPPIPA